MMLVLQRKLNESILLTTLDGDVVRITVVRLKGGSVRLGIDAPQSIDIVRHEVAQRRERDKEDGR